MSLRMACGLAFVMAAILWGTASADIFQEEDALLGFKKTLQDSRALQSWLSSGASSACSGSWRGVGCNPTNDAVVSLTMEGGDFIGEIPDEIKYLTFLKDLTIRETKFSGVIPKAIARLRNLENLIMSDNSGLSGPFPQWVLNLPKLEILNLSGNNLTGTLPGCNSTTVVIGGPLGSVSVTVPLPVLPFNYTVPTITVTPVNVTVPVVTLPIPVIQNISFPNFTNVNPPVWASSPPFPLDKPPLNTTPTVNWTVPNLNLSTLPPLPELPPDLSLPPVALPTLPPLPEVNLSLPALPPLPSDNPEFPGFPLQRTAPNFTKPRVPPIPSVTLPPTPDVSLPPILSVSLPPLNFPPIPSVTLPPIPDVSLPPIDFPPFFNVSIPPLSNGSLPNLTFPTLPPFPQITPPLVTLPQVPPLPSNLTIPPLPQFPFPNLPSPRPRIPNIPPLPSLPPLSTSTPPLSSVFDVPPLPQTPLPPLPPLPEIVVPNVTIPPLPSLPPLPNILPKLPLPPLSDIVAPNFTTPEIPPLPTFIPPNHTMMPIFPTIPSLPPLSSDVPPLSSLSPLLHLPPSSSYEHPNVTFPTFPNLTLPQLPPLFPSNVTSSPTPQFMPPNFTLPSIPSLGLPQVNFSFPTPTTTPLRLVGSPLCDDIVVDKPQKTAVNDRHLTESTPLSWDSSNNKLTRKIPSGLLKSRIKSIDVSSNCLTGIVPRKYGKMSPRFSKCSKINKSSHLSGRLIRH